MKTKRNNSIYEREQIFAELDSILQMSTQSGQTVLLAGDPGLGKTSVINAFTQSHQQTVTVHKGYCDALFTPRPLGPLVDIIDTSGLDFATEAISVQGRNQLFLQFLKLLQEQPSVLIIEDIHWADDGTLDFVKFLGRRIATTRCMLIVSYRPTDISEISILGLHHSDQPQIHRIDLKPLSKDTVVRICREKRMDGNQVYQLTGGNPFFTSEYILNASDDIPTSINNLILSRISVLDEEELKALHTVSLFPNSVSLDKLPKLLKNWDELLNKPIHMGLINLLEKSIQFRHEIVRMVVESSIPSLGKVIMHSNILEALSETEKDHSSQMIHHAKGAKKFSLVAKLAPDAARKARDWGAHKEAAQLFKMAIDCIEQIDDEAWIGILEEYSFECYMTNQLQEAIDYRYKILQYLKDTEDLDKLGNNYRWLSRLYWYQADSANAFKYAKLAIEILQSGSDNLDALARAYSNYGQLFMLRDDLQNSLHWNKKAYNLAKKLNHLEIQSHALTNIGSSKIKRASISQDGFKDLEQAERLAFKINNQDHIARIYTTLVCSDIIQRNDPEAILNKTLSYCLQNQIDSYYHYNLAWKSVYLFTKGKWADSLKISEELLSVKSQANINAMVAAIPLARILMRQGHRDPKSILMKAADTACRTDEPQRIVPVAIAMLEYEWLFDCRLEDRSAIHVALESLKDSYSYKYSIAEFAFWCSKVGMRHQLTDLVSGGFAHLIEADSHAAIDYWSAVDSPYELAMAHCMGDRDSTQKGIGILDQLGASQTKKRIREELKSSGRRYVPKGLLKSTRNNPLLLTNRELDVLKEMARGFTNAEISEALFISTKTVDHHVSSILSKLNASSRQRAVLRAQEHNII